MQGQMALTIRVRRRERALVTTNAATGAVARRCHTCRNGTRRRWVTCFDGVPTLGEDGNLETTCPACGREIADVVNVIGVDPAAL